MTRNRVLSFAGLLLASVFLTGAFPRAAAQSRRATASPPAPVYFDGGSDWTERGNSVDAATRIETDITQLQGDWTNGSIRFTIENGRWKWNGAQLGPVKIVGVVGDVLQVDMYLEEKPAQGGMLRAIFRRDKDTLYYCGTYGRTRPTEFKATDGNSYIVWKSAGK